MNRDSHSRCGLSKGGVVIALTPCHLVTATRIGRSVKSRSRQGVVGSDWLDEERAPFGSDSNRRSAHFDGSFSTES